MDKVELKVEEEMIEDVGFDQEEDQVLEKEEADEEDVYKVLVLHPKVTSWVDPVSGKTNHGIQVMDVTPSARHKRYELHPCPICCEPWTLDKIHQMRNGWKAVPLTRYCPQCYQDFSLESVRLLYATHLCIPFQRLFIGCFSFNKIGFIAFKRYVRLLRTIALNKRSDVFKQWADVLGRQNDAMKRRTHLLNRMAAVEKRADILERQNDAMKWQTEILKDEEWVEASKQQADAEKRAEVLRRQVDRLYQWADEYLRKADAFGQQAKTLLQQSKSLTQLVDSYVAIRKFYIQSYKEFLGLHD
nr:zinc finger, RING/FYVE/PHD-type [Tanacetum cinerariifolium]